MYLAKDERLIIFKAIASSKKEVCFIISDKTFGIVVNVKYLTLLLHIVCFLTSTIFE